MGVLLNSINTDFFRYLNKLNINCSQCDRHVILKFFSYSNKKTKADFTQDWNISESQFKNFHDFSSDLSAWLRIGKRMNFRVHFCSTATWLYITDRILKLRRLAINSCCTSRIFNRMYILVCNIVCNKWPYQRSVSSIIWLLMYLVSWSVSKSHNAFERTVKHLCQMNEKRKQATAREKRRMEKLNNCIEDLRLLICPLLKVN